MTPTQRSDIMDNVTGIVNLEERIAETEADIYQIKKDRIAERLADLEAEFAKIEPAAIAARAAELVALDIEARLQALESSKQYDLDISRRRG